MKIKINKLLTALLLVILIFNFIYGNYAPVYGANGVEGAVNVLVNLLGGVVGIFTWIPRLIAMAIGLAANVLTAQVAYMDGATDSGTPTITITPFDIFFNKVKLLDVNFLDTSVGGTTGTIRTAIAKWYYVMRLISIAILLLILLYVGIRMAFASVASEKADYKRSLVDWSVSLALVFVLQYIIMFTVNANSAIVGALQKVCEAGDNDKISDAIAKIATTSLGASWEAVASTVIYCMIVLQTFAIVVKYMKRMLTIGFLIIISPLISITYSIDKMGDKQAQALNTWLKEFVYNVLIQPFHCVMYMAFVGVAFKLLVEPPTQSWAILDSGLASAVLAILCIKFIDDGEAIVRKIFGFGDADTLSPLETAAMAGAVIQGGKMAVGAATSVRKGINFAKENGLASSIRKDFTKAKDNREIGKRTKALMKEGKSESEARATATESVKEERRNKETAKRDNEQKKTRRERKIQAQMKKDLGEDKYKELSKNSKSKEYKQAHSKAEAKVPQSNSTGRKIGRAVGKAWNSNTGRYIRKTMIPAGVGLAIGSMAYGAGGTSAFAAFGAGSAVYKGTKEFAKTSTNTLATDLTERLEGDVSNTHETSKKVNEVYQRGNNGEYENNSNETKKLIEEIKRVLEGMGEEKGKDQILSAISLEMLKGKQDFDLNDILKKAVGEEKAADPKLQAACQAYADHKNDGYAYEQIKNAEAIGVSLDTLIDKVDSRIDYSLAKGSDNTQQSLPTGENNDSNDNQSQQTQNGGSSDENGEQHIRVDVNNITTHIMREEKVEEIVNRVDEADVNGVINEIDNKLREFSDIKPEDKTPEMNEQIKKFENVRDRLQERLKEKSMEDN